MPLSFVRPENLFRVGPSSPRVALDRLFPELVALAGSVSQCRYHLFHAVQPIAFDGRPLGTRQEKPAGVSLRLTAPCPDAPKDTA